MESTLNFEHFEKKPEPHSLSISEVLDSERHAYLNALKVLFLKTLWQWMCQIGKTFQPKLFDLVWNYNYFRASSYVVSPPLWNSPCRGEGAYSSRSCNQSASTWTAQLSVAAKAVMPTDLFNHNVKNWVNTDWTRLERPSLVKAPLSV